MNYTRITGTLVSTPEKMKSQLPGNFLTWQPLASVSVINSQVEAPPELERGGRFCYLPAVTKLARKYPSLFLNSHNLQTRRRAS